MSGAEKPLYLPYGRQSVDDEDVAAVVSVLRGNYLTTGPVVEAFEERLEKKFGGGIAVSCANGTAALHLAFLALDIRPDDIVVVPTMTFLASANAARLVGAKVVFADVDPDTGLMTPETCLDAIDRAGGSITAIVVVHLNGHVADIESISDIACRMDARVIEDACHALGSTFGGTEGADHSVGSCTYSDCTAFSFHPVKTITTGEGGVLVCKDSVIGHRAKTFRNHGMTRDPQEFVDTAAAFSASGQVNPWYYEMTSLGLNYRLTDIQCALGMSQLSKLSAIAEKRHVLSQRYRKMLGGFSNIKCVAPRLDSNPCLHLFSVLIDFEEIDVQRAMMMQKLKERGIGTQVHYRPVHLQPYYKGLYGEFSLPGAERYYERQLSLPLFPAMTDENVDYVVSVLGEMLH